MIEEGKKMKKNYNISQWLEEDEVDNYYNAMQHRNNYIRNERQEEIQLIEKELKNKKAALNNYHDFKMLYPLDWVNKLKEYLPLVIHNPEALDFYIMSFQKETLEYITEVANYETKKNILLFRYNLFNKINLSSEEKQQYVDYLIREVIPESPYRAHKQLQFLLKEIKAEQLEKIVALKNKELQEVMNVAQFLFINAIEPHKINGYLLDNYSHLLLKDIDIIKMKEYLRIKSSFISICYGRENYIKVLPFAAHFSQLQESDKSYVAACVVKYLSPKNEKSIKYFQYIDTKRLQEIKQLCGHNKSKNSFFDLLLEKRLLDSNIGKNDIKNTIYKL